MANQVHLSTTDWVREQTELILERGTTDGVVIEDRPVVLFTVTGAKSGQKRYVPLMRVEKDGRYAMIGSIGGRPTNPSWSTTSGPTRRSRCRTETGCSS